MKKTIFAIAALATIGLTGCIKEQIAPVPVQEGNYTLAVRLAGAGGTRAVEETVGATPSAATLENGYIFIFGDNGSGTLALAQSPIAVTAAATTPTGQLILTPISDSEAVTESVFVIGNLPDDASFDIADFAVGTATPADVMAVGELITTLPASGADFVVSAPLATVDAGTKDFAAQDITFDSSDLTASVSISLLPVVSRIELAGITVGSLADREDPDYEAVTVNTGFDLTGIFLNDYYNQYTWSGSFEDTNAIINQTKTSLVDGIDATAGELGDIFTIAQKNVEYDTNKFVPVLAGSTSPVWAYNTTAGQLPKLMVRIQSPAASTSPDGDDINESSLYDSLIDSGLTTEEAAIAADTDGDGTHATTEPIVKYFTVTGYRAAGETTGQLSAFEPGNIYRVSAIPTDIDWMTTAGEYSLTVTVEVEDWTVVELDPIM